MSEMADAMDEIESIGEPPAGPAADYWSHPARREIKRLLDLGDANAILDELQNGTTEWDDAREALDNLVRAADMRAVALQEALAAAEASSVPSVERLAEILWTGRKKALDLADIPLRDLDPAIQDQYARFAAAVAEQLGDAEVCALADQRDEARTEAKRLRTDLQRSDELLVQAHNDLCEALGVRHRPLLDVVQHAATVRAEVERLRAELAEPVKDEDAAAILRILKAGDGTRSGATYLERAIRQTEKERDRLAEQAKRRASFEVGELGFGPDPTWRHADEIRCTACGAMIAQAQNFKPTLAELDALADRHQCLPRFDETGAPE